jgi:hypothetical protein
VVEPGRPEVALDVRQKTLVLAEYDAEHDPAAHAARCAYFYEGRRGRYANRLEALAKRARTKRLGLWERMSAHPIRPLPRRGDAPLEG